MSSPGIEELQELHYDRISPQYELHYGDPCSQEYRDRFINQPMFAGIDLHGLDVLEAMCGNGQTTEFLLSRGARVTGLDISTAEIDSFQQRWPGSHATCGSMLSSGFAHRRSAYQQTPAKMVSLLCRIPMEEVGAAADRRSPHLIRVKFQHL